MIYGGLIVVTEDRPEPGEDVRRLRRVFGDVAGLEDWPLECAAKRGLADDIEAKGGPEPKHRG